MSILDSIVAFLLKPLDWYYSAVEHSTQIWDSIFKPDVSKLEADSDIDGLTEALKYFTGDLSDDNPGTKAVLALGRMGDAAVEPLTRALYPRNHDNFDPLYRRTIHIRIGATVALGKTRHPLAVGPLIRALAHPDFTVVGAESPGIGKGGPMVPFWDRRNLTKRAIDALGEIGDAKALPHLERFARGIPGITEPTLTELRMCAYKAIARIEGNGNWDLTMEVFPDGDKPPRVLLGGNQVLIDSERSPYCIHDQTQESETGRLSPRDDETQVLGLKGQAEALRHPCPPHPYTPPKVSLGNDDDCLIHLFDIPVLLQDVGLSLMIEQGRDPKCMLREPSLEDRLSILQGPFPYAHYVDKHVLSAHQAWLLGGLAAAEHLLESDLTPVPDYLRRGMVTRNRTGSGCVKKAWGGGDEAKARALVKVFTGQMISYWFRNADKWQKPESLPLAEDSDVTYWFRKADKQKLLPEYMQRVGLEGAASVMLHALDFRHETTQGSVDDFWVRRYDEDIKGFIQIDRQWNWECDNNPIPFPDSCRDTRQHLSIEGQPFITYSLLLAKALEACRQRCVDWNTVPFPVRSMQQLIDKSTMFDHRPFNDLQERLFMFECIQVGLRVTRQGYRDLLTKLCAGEG